MLLGRPVDLFPPPTAPRDAVARAIAAELRRHGNHVHRASGGVVEFGGPGWFYLGFSMRRKAAAIVSGGVVTIDPATTARAVLELRFSVFWYLLLVLVGGVGVVARGSPGMRAMILAAVLLVWWFNGMMARWAYTSWIADGARRA